MSVLGRLIREGRIKKGISQPKLATELGLQSDALVNRWERGKQRVHFRHLRRLCFILDLDFDRVSRAWLTDLDHELQQKEMQCIQK